MTKSTGQFHLYTLDEDIIEVYLGEKDNPESEFIFYIHKSYIKDLAALLLLEVESEKST